MTSALGRWAGAVALLVAAALASFGCSGTEGDGTNGLGGTGGRTGTGGTGGAVSATIALPQCILDGYHALYEEFWGSPSEGLHHILRYVDHNTAADASVVEVKASLPDSEVLDPECESDPPRPRVLWSTFGWPRTNAWPDPGHERPQNMALFFQAMDVDLCELGSFYLERGFYQQTVAVVDWDIVEEERKIAAGTFSVAGLDHDSVRVTLVAFPECRLPEDDPPDAALLCPPPGETIPDDPNPWYDEGAGCRFEVTSLGIHVNLRTETPPFVFSMEYIAEFGGATEVSGLMVGREDGTVDVSGTYNGEPLTIVIDFDAGELTVELTGEPEKDCTFDTDTAEISECV